MGFFASGSSYIFDASLTGAKLVDDAITYRTASPDFRNYTLADVDNTAVGFTQTLTGTGSITEGNCLVTLASGSANGTAKLLGPDNAFGDALVTTVYCEWTVKAGVPPANANDAVVIGLSNDAASHYSYLYIGGDTPTQAQLRTLGGAGVTNGTAKTISLAAYHTYRFELDPGAARWYYDGVLQDTLINSIPSAVVRPMVWIVSAGGTSHNFSAKKMKFGVLRA